MLVLALMLAVPASVSSAPRPAPAKAKFDIVAKFQVGGLQLDVATFADPDSAAPDNKVGLIGIANSTLRNSISFHRNEWVSLIEIWARAVAVQSEIWTVVDSMTEAGTGDDSRLTVSAGPGVRFVIASAKEGAVSYNLSRADAVRFERALNRVRDLLSN
jgi:hypothetical protein